MTSESVRRSSSPLGRLAGRDVRRRVGLLEDPAIALVVLAFSVAPLIDAAGHPSTCGCAPVPWWGWGLVVAMCAPLAVRRRWPFAAPLATGIGAATFGVTTLPDNPIPYAAFVSLYTVAAHSTRVGAYAGGAIAAVAVPSATYISSDATAADYTVPMLLLSTAWLLGSGTRQRRERGVELEVRAQSLERTREAQAQAAVVAERNRIARDLHDVVAHSVTLMVVLAEAGPVALRSAPARAEQAFDDIAATGRSALTDMRQVLGALRDEATGRAPTRGLSSVDELVADVRRTGLDASLTVTGDVRDASSAVDIAAYRVVQESLTNVVRHAAASRVDVTVHFAENDLTVTVADDGTGATTSHVSGSGNGLLAMRERVELAGGSMTTGRSGRRGWSVRATMPLAARDAAR